MAMRVPSDIITKQSNWSSILKSQFNAFYLQLSFRDCQWAGIAIAIGSDKWFYKYLKRKSMSRLSFPMCMSKRTAGHGPESLRSLQINWTASWFHRPASSGNCAVWWFWRWPKINDFNIHATSSSRGNLLFIYMCFLQQQKNLEPISWHFKRNLIRTLRCMCINS